MGSCFRVHVGGKGWGILVGDEMPYLVVGLGWTRGCLHGEVQYIMGNRHPETEWHTRLKTLTSCNFVWLSKCYKGCLKNVHVLFRWWCSLTTDICLSLFTFPPWLYQTQSLSLLVSAQIGTEGLDILWINYATMIISYKMSRSGSSLSRVVCVACPRIAISKVSRPLQIAYESVLNPESSTAMTPVAIFPKSCCKIYS